MTELVNLAGTWQLSDLDGSTCCDMPIPGDVHSALLDHGLIPDPYFGANERLVQWVAKRDWVLTREFNIEHVDTSPWTLTLDEVDCVADVFINGHLIGHIENRFRRHRFEVSGSLQSGVNELKLHFRDAFAESQRRHENQLFELPYTRNGYRNAPLNLLRKSQCDSGWDWNICLMPIGVYGEATLGRGNTVIEHLQARQIHHESLIEVCVAIELYNYRDGTVALTFDFNGEKRHKTLEMQAGVSTHLERFTVLDAKLWWPSGQGDQVLYPLIVVLDGVAVKRQIGLRTVELITDADDIGTSMKFRVNGRDIFSKGVNWIPGDALPRRVTPTAVLPQLRAAVDANMNMIRVWGGGTYEKEWFYDACDELGLLVWQDFMFACMHYPSDRAFLNEVRAEASYQVKRLQHRACLALWCGDNEILGAMGWYEVAKANRDRYLVNYDRLNRVLEDVVEDLDPDRRFWASSPSLGPLDFADGWHCDVRGDMHFWDVWHSAKPFEHYRSVKPRFVSEFGFQSFPSMQCIATFTEPEDRNVSSPVMEVHQRNVGGNARMLETMTRYFRFPVDLEQMVFLSQIQQGLAMKTAIDFWRSLKPRCMGTLFWQLNDTWPVASWSSIEYGGRWKVLQYMARRFYAPVTVVAVPLEGTTDLECVAVSDVAEPVDLRIDIMVINMSGPQKRIWSGKVTVGPDAGMKLCRLSTDQLGRDEFLQIRWSDPQGRHVGTDDFMPRFHKEYDLQKVQPDQRWTEDELGTLIELEANATCFFTSLETSVGGHFSDNAFTLVKGEPKTIRWTGDPLERSDVRVRHLAFTY